MKKVQGIQKNEQTIGIHLYKFADNSTSFVSLVGLQ